MAIFYSGGYAIHGTTMVSRLGRVDSHGCIRLAPANARTLFDMVSRQRGATRIVIEGTSPRPAPPALVASRATRSAAAAPRTAQMRLAQPGRQVAAVPAGIRTAQGALRTGQMRLTPPGRQVAALPAGTRTAQGAPRTAGARAATSGAMPRVMASVPRDDNRHFTEWFLRR